MKRTATVTGVTRVTPLTVLAAALTAGDTVIKVESAHGFPDPPVDGTALVTVNGGDMAYTEVLEASEYGSGVTVDTLVLSTPAIAAADLGSRVEQPAAARYVATVFLDGHDDPEKATVRDGLIKAVALGLATTGLDTRVELVDDDGEWLVNRLLDQDPSDDGATIAPGSLPLSSTVDPEDAAGDQGGGSVLARLTNWVNIRVRNPIVTSLDSDDDGLTIGDPAGTLQFKTGGVVQTFLSAAYSRLAGHLSADTATFDGTAEHRADLNMVEGTNINLEADPKSPPAPGVSVEWPSVVTDAPGSAAKAFTVAAGIGYYVRTLPKQKLGNANLELRSFDPVAGGDSTQVWAVPLSANTLIHGLVVGSDWFTFVTTAPGLYAVQVRDTDGTLLSQWAPTVPGSGNSPCMGSDGTDLLLCWSSLGGYIIQHYSTSGVLGAVVTTSSVYGIPGDILGGNFDFGSYRYIIRESTGNQFDVYNAAGVEQTGEAWDSPVLLSEVNSVGLAWDSTASVFRELLFTGTSYTYSGAEKAQYLSPRTWWAFESWQDGTHETAYDAALPTSFVFPPRKTVRASGAAIPSQATRGALYLAQSASLPTRTSFHLQGTPVNGDRDWLVTNPGTGGAAPLATSTYASGTAAALVAADGTALIRGDQTGHIFDLIAAGGGGGSGVSDDDIYADESTGDIYFVAT